MILFAEMPNLIYPKKLKKGDQIRVIAPSFSMQLIPKKVIEIAVKRFEEMGLKVTFGDNTDKKDIFESSSIEERLSDLMAAFSDNSVNGIIAAMGGYNVNYLLEGIDWDIVRNNPKFLCGMSDITVLSNAILAKTGLVTYSGPNFRNFGQEKYFDFTLEHFKKVAFEDASFNLLRSDYWSDDKWAKNQEKRKLIKSKGWWVINEGQSEGEIVGGNLCSVNLLQGTKFMPDIKGKILFIEDDSMSTVGEFSRNWQSLMHLPDFNKVRGIVFGRFQKKTKMTQKKLTGLIRIIKALEKIPVIGNVDFGHTDPKITFPIGGEARILVGKKKSEIEIIKH